MISAKEAKALYDESGAEAEAMMKQFEKPIQDAAKAGKRTVFCYLGSNETWVQLETTPIQKQVMDKLSALGFRISFCKDGEEFVPRALADDDGKGPKYYSYGFAIHW